MFVNKCTRPEMNKVCKYVGFNCSCSWFNIHVHVWMKIEMSLIGQIECIDFINWYIYIYEW